MRIGSFVAIIQSAFVAVTGESMYKAPKGSGTRGFKISRNHPYKKLQGFNKGMCKVTNKTFKDKKASVRVCNRFSRYTHHVVKQFNTKRCAYYDPFNAGKHGGPNPNKAQRGMRLNHKGVWIPRSTRRRDRRDDDHEDDDGTEEELDEDFENGCDGTETGFAAELCSEELIEDYYVLEDIVPGNNTDLPATRGKRKNKKKKQKKVKLTKNEKSFRKGLVNLIKFCNQYLSDCYHVRVGNQCEKRARNFWNVSRPKMKGYKPVSAAQSLKQLKL